MKDATLIIGDIEGYSNKLEMLIEHAAHQTENIVLHILTGDIVGNGPCNLETIRWCYENQEKLKLILGNKDYLLQQTIKGYQSGNSKWVETIAHELSKKENHTVRDFFMGSFIRFLVSDNFIVSHARLRNGKGISDHTDKQLSGVNPPKKGVRHYIDPKGRILFHGHHSREGYAVEKDGEGKILRICLDSGAGKGTRYPLTGALIGRKKEKVIILNTKEKREEFQI